MNDTELNSKIVKLIIEDTQLKDFIEASKNRGIDFVDFSMEDEKLDKKNMTFDFNIQKTYRLNKQFNRLNKIDTIAYHIDNQNHLTINDITFLDNQEEAELKRLMNNSGMDVDYNQDMEDMKYDNKRRVRNIEDYTNDLLEEIEADFIKSINGIKILINELIEEHFKNQETDTNFKEKIGNFIRSYKIKRLKSFTKSMIKNSTKIRVGQINLKLNKLLGFNNKAWSQIFQDYKEASLLKEEKEQIRSFDKEMKNIIDNIIDVSFINLAEENYKLNVIMKEKYNIDFNEDEIEVDRRQLLLEVFKELEPIFRKYGLNKTDFRVV